MTKVVVYDYLIGVRNLIEQAEGSLKGAQDAVKDNAHVLARLKAIQDALVAAKTVTEFTAAELK